MGVLFGDMSKNRDISTIVESLQKGSIVNEAVCDAGLRGLEVRSMADQIQQTMLEHYSDAVDSRFEKMLQEDAADTAQLFHERKAVSVRKHDVKYC